MFLIYLFMIYFMMTEIPYNVYCQTVWSRWI